MRKTLDDNPWNLIYLGLIPKNSITMKKITLLLICLVSFSTYAQYLTEGFEGAAFPPAGWSVVNTNANQNWQAISGLQDGSGNQTVSPTEGALAAAVLFDVAQQNETLTTPAINLTGATAPQLIFDANISYAWAVSPNDNFDVTVSVIQGSTTTAIWTEADLGVFNSQQWYEIVLDLTPYVGSTINLEFNYNGADGDYAVIDDIKVEEQATAVPEATVTPTPADMAIGVIVDTADGADTNTTPDNAVTFSWSTPRVAGSVAPTEYEVFLGDSPTTLASLGIVPTTVTSAPIQGFFYNTTYYWQVIARNSAGDAVNSAIWSFTTEAGSISAPLDSTTPTPADFATNVAIDAANTDAVTLTWTPATTGDAAEVYLVSLSTDPTTLSVLGSTAGTTATITNMLAGTTYYWQIQPRNVGGLNETTPVWRFTTAGTASIDENKESFFTLSPNPATNVLNIESQETIKNATIFNGLGQLIQNNASITASQIDISQLSSGLYLLKLESDKGTETVRFIKN